MNCIQASGGQKLHFNGVQILHLSGVQKLHEILLTTLLTTLTTLTSPVIHNQINHSPFLRHQPDRWYRTSGIADNTHNNNAAQA